MINTNNNTIINTNNNTTTYYIVVAFNKGCAYITNQVQWYAGHSPIVKSTVITEKWIYNEERAIWQMQEQTEGY